MAKFGFLALSLGLALGLAGCGPQRIGAPAPDAAFSARTVAFLDRLQARSIAGDREYCGYLGVDAAGAFVFSGPDAGGKDWCETALPRDFRVVASYHTHGAHGTEYIAEIPSPEDVDTDVAEGVFGYVATPGGRVWLIDWRDATARQICGAACVTQDPGYDASEAGSVGRVYSRATLAARFGY